MKFYSVIMAGGSGTRFWPLSRRKKPKQFLPIVSEKTMIEETVARLLSLLPREHIYTISNQEQARSIKQLVPILPRKNILVEPRGRNTAASLILATATIYLKDQEGVVAALPADHLIASKRIYKKKLWAALELASKEEAIITFGIPPTYPATGYGYIHFSSRNPLKIRGEHFYPVLRFTEKPAYRRAREFLAGGKYYWNSGMFIWRADVFARKLEKHAPLFYSFWEMMIRALQRKDIKKLAEVFREIPSLSIDYALMEKAAGVLVNRGDFGWSDIGSWASLGQIWPRDGAGNASRGEGITLDSQNCLVFNPKKFTALIGAKDLIVVETDDALLVCHKDYDHRVREVLDLLNRKGRKEYL